MNFGNCFCTAILLIATFCFTAQSQFDTRPVGKRLCGISFPSVFPPPAAAAGGCAKAAAVKKDILAVTHIDNYAWNDSSWEPDGFSRYSYDTLGRIIGTRNSLDAFMDDTTVYSYDSDNQTLRSISVSSSYPSIYGADTMLNVAAYYPSYDKMTGILAYTSLNSYSISENWDRLSLDSAISAGMVRDTVTGGYDTVISSSVHYSKVNDTHIRATARMYMSTLMDEPFDYQTDYIRRTGNGSDTLLGNMIFDIQSPNPYAQVLMNMRETRIVDRYDQQGRTVEQLLQMSNPDSANASTSMKIMTVFNTSGTIDYNIVQMWDTLTGAWRNSMKAVYTYSPIFVPVKHPGHAPECSAQRISANWKSGAVRLTLSPDLHILSAVHYDLHGRTIRRFEGINRGNSNNISFPLSGANGSICILQVKTNRGVFTFRGSTVR